VRKEKKGCGGERNDPRQQRKGLSMEHQKISRCLAIGRKREKLRTGEGSYSGEEKKIRLDPAGSDGSLVAEGGATEKSSFGKMSY